MAGQRMRRVNEAVREVLSEAIIAGLKDPRIGFVTVTSVNTSADFRYARVYVSVLGDERQRQETLAGLESCGGYLQQQLAAKLKLRHTPQLNFLYDDSIDYGLHIEKLLKETEGE